MKCTFEHVFPLLLLSISSSPLSTTDSSLDINSSLDTNSSFHTNPNLHSTPTLQLLLLKTHHHLPRRCPPHDQTPTVLLVVRSINSVSPTMLTYRRPPPRNKSSAFLNCSRKFCSTYRTAHDSRRPTAIRYHASRLSCLSFSESTRRSRPRSFGARS